MDVFGLSKSLELLVQEGLLIDPWLSSFEDTVWGDSLLAFKEIVEQLVQEYPPIPWEFPDELLSSLYQEVFLTTLEIEASRGIHLQSAMKSQLIEQTHQKIRLFLERYGGNPILDAVTVMHMRDILRFVSYRGPVSENAILNREPLQGFQQICRQAEFHYAVQAGMIALDEMSSANVSITEMGLQCLHQYRLLLKRTGFEAALSNYFMERGFNHLDWDRTIQLLMPKYVSIRRSFLEYAGIQPGTRVLEIGCGTGTLTIDAGLYERVWPDGKVDCIEPGANLLQELGSKLEAAGIQNVNLYQGQAEKLPFADHFFDAAVGYLSFNLTDCKQSILELIRVTKPGGRITMAIPGTKIAFSPCYLEWFSPLLELSKQLKQDHLGSHLLKCDEILRLFEEVGLNQIKSMTSHDDYMMTEVETTLQHAILWYGEALSLLPYEDRIQLEQEMYSRGHALFAEFPLSKRINVADVVFVSGIR